MMGVVKLAQKLLAGLGMVIVLLGMSACATEPKPPQTNHTPNWAKTGRNGNANTAVCNTAVLQVSNETAYRDVNGTWWVIGQVSNQTSEDVKIVTLCISVEDGTNKQTQTWLMETSVRSGETVPFRAVVQNKDIALGSKVSVTAHPEVRVDGRAIAAYREFTVSALTAEKINDHRLQFHGTLRNTGNQKVRDVRVVVALYDAEERLVGVADGKVNVLGPLEPGAKVAFTATTSKAVGEFSRAEPLVEGNAVSPDEE
jgi:hypothetical protein